MKAQHLLPALAMVLVTAMPAMAHGHGWGRQARDHWQQAPSGMNQCQQGQVATGYGQPTWQAVPPQAGYGGWHHRQVGYGQAPVVVYNQPTRVITRQVPVYVPVQQVVYQQVPVRTQPQCQPGASVTFRVRL